MKKNEPAVVLSIAPSDPTTVACCPVCRGNGLVPHGFYLQTSGYWASSNTATETCRSCNGNGYIVIENT